MLTGNQLLSSPEQGMRSRIVQQSDGHQEERERILDAAEMLLRRFGRGKVTIGDIASAAATSRAYIYRHFPTRAAIDLSLYTRIAKRDIELVHAAAAARTEREKAEG